MSHTETAIDPLPLHLGPGESGGEPASPQLLADPVGFLVEGFRRHGPVFRAKYRGTDCVVIAGLEANEFFWQNPENWSFAAARRGFTNQLGPTHVTRLEGAPHARKRRLLKPGFGMEAVARHVPTMAAEARSFLASPEGERTDLMEVLMHLLLALNRRTMLQLDLNEAERVAIVGFEVDLMYGINTSVDPDAHYAGLGYCRDRETVFGLLDREVAARLGGRRQEDNLQALIDQAPGALGALTAEELRYDSYLLLIAGIENTSRLIARAVERTCAHPQWAAAIREELRDYGASSFVRGVGAFPSLRAFIQETERLHPGLIFMSRRAARPLDFQGHVIPTGRTVLQVHTLLHFLPEYNPDPMQFDPARWLQAEPSRRTHLTFGGGAHVCLGINLARLHMPIVLAELLRNYDVVLGYKPAFGYVLDPGLGRRHPAFPVRLVRRS